MKNKTKFLLTTLFILVAFLLLGTTNVNAATLVETEQQLRNAVSSSSITEVKLGANIELTGDLGIFPVNDLILDLNGNTIDGQKNSKSIYIRYGRNGNTNGSLTIKDSGESAGSIKACQTIDVGNYNEETSTEKNYRLIIENGQFYVQGGAWSDRAFELLNSFANRNVTFDFQVKDGYFELGYSSGAVLFLSNSFTKGNVKLNINFDKLTYYGESQTNNRLIYLSPSADFSIKLSEVVSDSSKVVLKRNYDGTTVTLTDLDVSATSSTPLNSALNGYNTIEVVKKDGFDVSDVTLNETYGYTTATAKSIKITNRGANALKVKNVSVSSENFIVTDTVGTTDYLELASLASNDTRYTIKAKTGLNAGTYTGTITVTDENDKTYTATVKIIVAKKGIVGLGIGYDGDWKYGETPTTLSKSGVESLSESQYVVEYSVHDANSWSETVPTLAGNYDVRIRVTDSNYDNSTASTSQFNINPDDTQIRIVPNNHEWTYDGESHSDNGYKIYSGSTTVTELINGDTINVVVIGSVKDVKDTKTANNKIDSYTITDTNGNDVTNCYSNIISAQGNLTIKPITTQIIVTADSASKAYDGTALTKNSYTYTNDVLLAGDTLKVTITGSQTYVGTTNNEVSNVKVMRSSEDITSNYTFGTHVNGTLEVTAVDQPLSIADQYVIVNNKLSTSVLKQELNGAEGMVSFELKSGTAGVYNDELYGGFNAGTAEGTVVMTAKATSFDANGDGTPEYNETTKDFNIHVVTKQNVTISGITNNQKFIYDGTAKTPAGTLTVEDNKIPVSNLEVSYAGTGSTTYSSTTAPKNAGTYTVTYKVPNSNANYVGSATFNFTINKAKLAKVTLKQNSFEYTGSEISIEQPNNWVLGLMSPVGDFDKTDVGNYAITVSLNDKNNYEWADGTTTDLTLNWSITKANPSYTVPTNLTGLKGQKLNNISLPDNFTWNNVDESLVVGTHTYKATYTPEDTDNYNIINDIDITVVTKNIFNVTTSVVGGNGTISTSYANVVEGSTKEITFTPDTGYMIDKVTVNGTPVTVTNNKLTLTVDENKDVKVSYKKIPFTIIVVDTEGATIDSNGAVVNYGDSKQFTIYADYGYNFVKVLVNDVDKTDEMVGDTLTLNNITANMEIKVVVEKIIYEVIEGANQKYTITKDSEAKFRIDADYSKFENGGKVYVDGELVDAKNYTSKSGSTVITLKQAYVDTLSVGEHTLKVAFNDGGEATTNFTIAKVEPTPDEDSTVDVDNNNTNTENKEQDKKENKKEENKEEDKSSNPKTFDNIMVYVGVAMMSVVGLGATVVIKKKKEN